MQVIHQTSLLELMGRIGFLLAWSSVATGGTSAFIRVFVTYNSRQNGLLFYPMFY